MEYIYGLIFGKPQAAHSIENALRKIKHDLKAKRRMTCSIS